MFWYQYYHKLIPFIIFNDNTTKQTWILRWLWDIYFSKIKTSIFYIWIFLSNHSMFWYQYYHKLIPFIIFNDNTTKQTWILRWLWDIYFSKIKHQYFIFDFFFTSQYLVQKVVPRPELELESGFYIDILRLLMHLEHVIWHVIGY